MALKKYIPTIKDRLQERKDLKEIIVSTTKAKEKIQKQIKAQKRALASSIAFEERFDEVLKLANDNLKDTENQIKQLKKSNEKS